MKNLPENLSQLELRDKNKASAEQLLERMLTAVQRDGHVLIKLIDGKILGRFKEKCTNEDEYFEGFTNVILKAATSIHSCVVVDKDNKSQEKFEARYYYVNNDVNKIDATNKNIRQLTETKPNSNTFEIQREFGDVISFEIPEVQKNAKKSDKDNLNIVIPAKNFGLHYLILEPINEKFSKTRSKYSPANIICVDEVINFKTLLEHEQILLLLAENNPNFQKHFFKIAKEIISCYPDNSSYSDLLEINSNFSINKQLSSEQWYEIILTAINRDEIMFSGFPLDKLLVDKTQTSKLESWLIKILLAAIADTNMTLDNTAPDFHEQLFKVVSSLVSKNPENIELLFKIVNKFNKRLSTEQWIAILKKNESSLAYLQDPEIIKKLNSNHSEFVNFLTNMVNGNGRDLCGMSKNMQIMNKLTPEEYSQIALEAIKQNKYAIAGIDVKKLMVEKGNSRLLTVLRNAAKENGSTTLELIEKEIIKKMPELMKTKELYEIILLAVQSKEMLNEPFKLVDKYIPMFSGHACNLSDEQLSEIYSIILKTSPCLHFLPSWHTADNASQYKCNMLETIKECDSGSFERKIYDILMCGAFKNPRYNKYGEKKISSFSESLKIHLGVDIFCQDIGGDKFANPSPTICALSKSLRAMLFLTAYGYATPYQKNRCYEQITRYMGDLISDLTVNSKNDANAKYQKLFDKLGENKSNLNAAICGLEKLQAPKKDLNDDFSKLYEQLTSFQEWTEAKYPSQMKINLFSSRQFQNVGSTAIVDFKWERDSLETVKHVG